MPDAIVYRSDERNAETDATAMKNLLLDAGLHPELLDETALSVTDGSWAIQVPEEEADQARSVLEDALRADGSELDPSADLDFVTVASADGTLAEIEATSIQSILDANGINCVVVGNATLPNLGFEVRVARAEADHARQAIEEARQAGPAAAEEGEAATEPEA